MAQTDTVKESMMEINTVAAQGDFFETETGKLICRDELETVKSLSETAINEHLSKFL